MTHPLPPRFTIAFAAFLSALYLPQSLHADDAAEAIAMVTLATDHPEQGRAELTIDSILSQTAQAKAEDILARNYFDHTNPDGIGPNQLAESFGYILPDDYSQELDGNNIESIYKESGLGPSSADRTFAEWLNSPGHRIHVLAADAGGFYAEQTHVGVGVASDPATDTNIFVFITAPPSLGGVDPPPPTDTWSAYYTQAQSYYDYYVSIGYFYYGAALYHYYQNYGTYLFHVAYGNLPDANYSYSNGLALYYYYLYFGYGDYASANLYYYYYLAVATYDYYAGYGDFTTAQYYYNLYLGYAYGV